MYWQKSKRTEIVSSPVVSPLNHLGRGEAPLTPPARPPLSQSAHQLYLKKSFNFPGELSSLPGEGCSLQPLASTVRLEAPSSGFPIKTGEESQALVSRWSPKPRWRVTWPIGVLQKWTKPHPLKCCINIPETVQRETCERPSWKVVYLTRLPIEHFHCCFPSSPPWVKIVLKSFC